jgi:preprotein translocase subunit YajC
MTFVYLNNLFQSQSNQLISFLPIVMMFGIVYFLLIMPMQRQRKQMKKMLESLENGNVVQTSGGIVGTIVSINPNDDTLVLRVKPDNVKLQVVRSSVAALIAEK